MKNALVILLLLVVNISIAQEDAASRLEKANQLASENPEKAIEGYKEILKVEAETSPIYANAFFNIAVVYSGMGEIENTRLWYEKVMDSNLNPKHEGPSFFEPYACYQHNAAMQLGIFLYDKELYKEALNCFVKAKEKYPYLSSSGTSLVKRSSSIDIWKSRCYMAMGDMENALSTLISSSMQCFSPMKNELDASIEELIANYYGEGKFKKALKKGVKKLKLKGDAKDELSNEVIIWQMPLESSIIDICTNDKTMKKEQIVQMIKEQSWYK